LADVSSSAQNKINHSDMKGKNMMLEMEKVSKEVIKTKVETETKKCF
jgi:hypothetical protein